MLPPHILLALVAMLLVGVADFTYGRAARRGVRPGTITTSQACLLMPATGIWALLEGTYAWRPATLLGAVAAVLIFTGFWAFMRSVSLGEASVSTPIYRISFVITALVAIAFLGEPLTWRKGAGFVLAAGAVFTLSDFRPGAAAGGASPARGASVAWALLAMVSVGLLNVVYKLGVTHGVAPAMFLHGQAVFFITIAFAYARFAEGGPHFSPEGWAHAGVTAVCFMVGLIALLAALKRGEASVVTPIAQLSFVVSALLAAVAMRERITRRKLAGLALAVATIAAFAPL